MTWNYLIEASSAGTDEWRQLFRCLTPEAVGEVVRILLTHGNMGQEVLRITPYAVSAPPPTSGQR